LLGEAVARLQCGHIYPKPVVAGDEGALAIQ
jgi:hypothetical protein